MLSLLPQVCDRSIFSAAHISLLPVWRATSASISGRMCRHTARYNPTFSSTWTEKIHQPLEEFKQKNLTVMESNAHFQHCLKSTECLKLVLHWAHHQRRMVMHQGLLAPLQFSCMKWQVEVVHEYLNTHARWPLLIPTDST